MFSHIRLWLLSVGMVFFLMSCQKIISGNGVVMDKDTGLPLKGVSVDAYLEHPSPDTFQMHTQTDAKGNYVVSSNPQSCTGSCPDIYVEILFTGYSSAYVKNPHGDTTWLSPASRKIIESINP